MARVSPKLVQRMEQMGMEIDKACASLCTCRYVQVYTSRNAKMFQACISLRPYTQDEAVFVNYRSFFEGTRSTAQ